MEANRTRRDEYRESYPFILSYLPPGGRSFSSSLHLHHGFFSPLTGRLVDDAGDAVKQPPLEDEDEKKSRIS